MAPSPGLKHFSVCLQTAAGRRHQQGPGSSNHVTVRPPRLRHPHRAATQAGNQMKPPAVFRDAASRSRLRHPRPAPVGHLDPDNAADRRFDRDRQRLPGSTRAAMPQAVGEQLARQQSSHAPARVPGAQRPLHERAGQPRPIRPSRKRHGLPDHQPSHQRTPPSGPPRPRESRGPSGGTPGWTLDSAANVKARRPPERAPEPPVSGCPHRSLAPISVRYVSVDTATSWSTALRDDTRWDKGKWPASTRRRS